MSEIDRLLTTRGSIGAVIAEPLQGRAGIIVPPDGFLRDLHALCTSRGALLILDEIYTGFGRTGTLFAAEHDGVRPDILCVGKALGGGFPLSATILARRVADAWQPSHGEALHTSTYLGNPMACAAALANLDEIARLDLVARARNAEPALRRRLETLRGCAGIVDVRGRGMLWGVEFEAASSATACVVGALQRGLILLQSGVRGQTIALAPPLVISDEQLTRALTLFESAIGVQVTA